MINDKKSGLLYGTFCADALSLGVHWIYDTQELEEKHGRITHYKTPGPESYHPPNWLETRVMWAINLCAC